LETAVLFLMLALAVILAVYGWLGTLGAWGSGKEADRNERLVYLFIASIFTALAASPWYALTFVVRPFG
jgi:predicted MFS family arabinose efflux permease